MAAPPDTALGGVASYTSILIKGLPGARRFDQWWPLRKRSSNRLTRAVVHVLNLMRWAFTLLTERPHVVHLQVTAPGIVRDVVYAKLAHRIGIPVVSHLHTSGFTGTHVSSTLYSRVYHLLDATACLVVMSDDAAAAMRKTYPRMTCHVFSVPNPAPQLPPAPLNVASALTPSRCKFLVVGEISHLKNQAAIVRAVRQLNAQGLDACLEVVGPWGELEADERQLLEEDPYTHCVGPKREAALSSSYASADVFVLFSRTEAEPLAMLEAMMAGLPVVATRVGSIPATLSTVNAPNDCLDPADEESLVTALRRWAHDPERRLSVGKANQEWARTERSVEKHVAQLKVAYEFAIKHRDA